MTAEITLEKLYKEPLYTAKVIVYNNPQAVAANLDQLVGYNPANTEPANVLDALLEVLPSITTPQLIEVLSVEFNPLAPNETSQFFDALEMAGQNADTSGITTWGEAFKEPLSQLHHAYRDFTGAEDAPGNTAGETPKKPCCKACKHREDARQLFLIVGGGLLAIFLIVTLSAKTA